ncbi:hypothetical protein ID741_002918 [Enterococcus sp. AZ103]
MGEAFMSYHPDPYVRNYDDRKMAKWLGFYLSEHTAEMNKEEKDRHEIWQRREIMSDEAIGKILNQAYTDQQKVRLQLAFLNSEGQPEADLIGVIAGIDQQTIYLVEEMDHFQTILLEQIQYVELVTYLKWSEEI